MAEQLLIYDYTEIDPFWGFETPVCIGYGRLTAEYINSQVDAMSGDIDVHINSQGGKVFDGWAIYNKLKMYDRGVVNVFVDGIAASIASIIAMSGDAVSMMQASMMMIHKPTGFYCDAMNADELASEAQSLTEIESVLIDVYATKTGLSATKLQNLIDAATWLSPDSALALGFADKIIKTETKPVISQDAFNNLFTNASASTRTYVNSAFTINTKENMSTLSVKDLAEKQDKTNTLLGDFINFFKGEKKNEAETAEPPVSEAPVAETEGESVEELKAKITALETEKAANAEKVTNAESILNQATEMYNKVQTQLEEVKSNYKPAGKNTDFNSKETKDVNNSDISASARDARREELANKKSKK